MYAGKANASDRFVFVAFGLERQKATTNPTAVARYFDVARNRCKHDIHVRVRYFSYTSMNVSNDNCFWCIRYGFYKRGPFWSGLMNGSGSRRIAKKNLF